MDRSAIMVREVPKSLNLGLKLPKYWSLAQKLVIVNIPAELAPPMNQVIVSSSMNGIINCGID